MCRDYSLEMYKSRPAVAGEDLVLKKFTSGSKGFVGASDANEPSVIGDAVCVCCEPGMTMTLHREEGDIDVTFATNPALYCYKDGVTLSDGKFVILQSFEPGMRATVIKPLPESIADAASAAVAFEPEIKVEELVPLAHALV
jgi:hypothetical protein